MRCAAAASTRRPPSPHGASGCPGRSYLPLKRGGSPPMSSNLSHSYSEAPAPCCLCLCVRWPARASLTCHALPAGATSMLPPRCRRTLAIGGTPPARPPCDRPIPTATSGQVGRNLHFRAPTNQGLADRAELWFPGAFPWLQGCFYLATAEPSPARARARGTHVRARARSLVRARLSSHHVAAHPLVRSRLWRRAVSERALPATTRRTAQLSSTTTTTSSSPRRSVPPR